MASSAPTAPAAPASLAPSAAPDASVVAGACRCPAPAETPPRSGNRRTARTRCALRDALAAEIRSAGGLDRVAVTALAERADVTRRTFYSHYKDIPDLVEQCEGELLEGIARHISRIADTSLDELYQCLRRLEPCPGSVELLRYIQDNGDFMGALMGPGGDPRFVEKIKVIARDTVNDRALHGIDERALGPFFDYYVTFAVSAEVGVIQKWLVDGMREGVELMARALTLLTFVRPGDLYGKPIDLDVPLYGQIFAHIKETEEK